MQGKRHFSPGEASQIKALLRDKAHADRSGQKILRGRLRKLDFYISDFETDQHGFTECDFDDLVKRGIITIDTSKNGEIPREPGQLVANLADDLACYRDSDGEGIRHSSTISTDVAAARQRRAQAAAKYRPEKIGLLLIAEAPPQDTSRYFYFEDVPVQDSLFRYIVRGILDSEPARRNKRELLEELRVRSVYLIDLMEDPKRANNHDAHVDALIQRCRELSPGAIVLIKAPVFDACHRPLANAGLPVVAVRVPFPGSGQQRNFQEKFPLALAEARALLDGP